MDLKNNYFLKLFVSFLLLFSLVSQPLQLVAFAMEEIDTDEQKVSINDQDEKVEADEEIEDVEIVQEEIEDENVKEEISKDDEKPEEPLENISIELKEKSVTSNTITVKWESSDHSFDHYEVFLDGKLVKEIEADQTSYTFKELRYKEIYQVYIIGVLTNNEGEKIEIESDSLEIKTYLTVEEKKNIIDLEEYAMNLKVVEKSSDSITVTWDPSEAIDYYMVYLNNEEVEKLDGLENTYTFKNLSVDRDYYLNIVPYGKYIEYDSIEEGYFFYNWENELYDSPYWNEEEVKDAIPYYDFDIDLSVTNKTSDSISIEWEATHDGIYHYDLYLDDEKIETIDADINAYTFKNLNINEEYDIQIVASGLFYDEYDDEIHYYETERHFYTYEAPYWSENELTPVSLIFIFNDYLNYDEYYRIRGLDKDNKAFKVDEPLNYSEGDLQMPIGNYELIIYNNEDPNISLKETFDIKEHTDYERNPIQFKINIEELRKQAKPFIYQITDVTEDSFTIQWNNVPKINGYKIYGYNEYGEEHSFTVDKIDKGTSSYTVNGLKENYRYSINLLTQYVYELEREYYFNLKTVGEDAKATPVMFTNEALKEAVSEELGVYKRNVTEVDIGKLRYLSVYSAEIADLSALELAHNLENLYLDSNEISNIDVLQGKEKLDSLSLDWNNITDIRPIKDLKSLSYLELAGNKIKDISSLEKLVNLYSLRLNSNELSDISSLSKLVNLSYLNLDSNEIESIDSLRNLIQLYSLRASNNKIQQVESLSSLQDLESLFIGNNNISEIDSLKSLTQLTSLEIDENNITDIASLENLHELTDLNISSNSIEKIDAIANLQFLETVDLSFNEIKTLPSLSGMSALENLRIYSNQITDISGLKGLTNLRYLDLDYNPITDISVLLELPKLETVWLYGTEVKDEEVIRQLRDSGVEVYHDLDDWNDWEDEDEEDFEVDLEEILDAFPEDSGFIVDEDGKVSLDLTNKESTEKVELTPEQTEVLIKNNQNLTISKGEDVQLSIPPTAFDNSDEKVEININEIENVEGSLSKTYDFTIKQGDRTISQFDEGITFTFDVTPNKNTKTKNLKVYYYNEETKKWEKIGGTFNNGKVTVVTYHFSKFTVLEEKDINELFTSQAGYVVDDEYSTIITYQLSHSNEFVLSPEQLQRLHEDEDQIHFYLQGESFAFVPYYSDLNVEEELKVTFKEIENTKNDLSNTFDIQLNQKDMSGNSYIGKLDLGLKRKLSKGETVNLYELIGNKWVKTLRDDVQSIASEDVQAYIPNNGTFTVFASDADEIELEEEVNPNPDLDGSEDEESNETDIEGILSVFPKDSGFIVSQVGTISFDLMNKESTEKVELTPEQITILIKNKLALIITKGEDVQLSIPSTVFDNSDEKVEIHVKEIEKTKDSLSKTYDFTIKQGERTISQFDEGITLTFDVIPNKNTNTENLKVFYLNEKTGKWEKVGGTFKDGKVTAVTNHFSQFTVFDEAEVEDEMNPTPNPEQKPDPTPNPTPDSESSEQNTDSKEESVPEKSEIDNEKNNDDKEQNIPEESDGVTKDQDKISTQKNEKESEKNELPNTATNVMNYMLIGFILILTASTVLFIRRKRL